MGIIFDIQRCSYLDGPGIRTTVFFKGCQLRCVWCHNPESFCPEPQLRFLSHQCQLCGKCAEVCPQGGHSFTNGVHTVDFSRCTGCGICAEHCPSQALQLVGYEISAQQIMDTVLRDKAYYNATGGGITISGGEPTMQPEFLLELLSLSREHGIHTCLETNGYIPQKILGRLLDKVDLFLLDYKITDPQMLRSYTGASGDLWHNTLETLQRSVKPVILRMPVIPGINDITAHFQEAADLKKAYPCIEKVEIMAYHAIGADKWKQLGYAYNLEGLPSVTPEQKARWETALASLL